MSRPAEVRVRACRRPQGGRSFAIRATATRSRFYLGRDDLRAYRSKTSRRLRHLVRRQRPRHVILCTHRHSLRGLEELLPPESRWSRECAWGFGDIPACQMADAATGAVDGRRRPWGWATSRWWSRGVSPPVSDCERRGVSPPVSGCHRRAYAAPLATLLLGPHRGQAARLSTGPYRNTWSNGSIEEWMKSDRSLDVAAMTRAAEWPTRRRWRGSSS